MSRFSAVLVLMAVGTGVVPASAAVGESAQFLPETTAFYAEIAEPATLIDTVADHPLLAKVQQTQAYRDASATPQYVIGQFVLGSIEAKLEQKWRPALQAAFGKGITVAFDADTKGAVLIAQAEDAPTLERLVSVLMQLVREDAKGKNKPDPVQEEGYREITVYRRDEVAFAIHEGRIVATNNDQLGRSVLDRMLDGGEKTLAAQPGFQDATELRNLESDVWLYADLNALRDATGEDSPLTTGVTDNFLAEVLIGGAIDTLQKSPYLTGQIEFTADDLSVSISSPHDEAWISEARHYFFGNDGHAPAALTVGKTVFTLGAYRDLSEMWLRSGDLFNQKTDDELAKADTVLSTLFSGKDFGEDVLGALEPEVQLVFAHQDLVEGLPKPAVRLPSFALVGTLKEPETMRPDFRRTFLSLIGFLNITGAMEGRPQLDFEVSSEGNDQVIVTSYVIEKDRVNADQAPLYFNFSPSVAFVEEQIVISSTERLARDLVISLRQPRPTPDAPANTAAELAVPVLHQILIDNREPLVAQNMLSEGHDREEAEREIDGLLTLVSLFERARLTLDTNETAMQLHLEMTWTE